MAGIQKYAQENSRASVSVRFHLALKVYMSQHSYHRITSMYGTPVNSKFDRITSRSLV